MARIADFENYLLANNIPFTGSSWSEPISAATVTINFAPEATQEQIDWANNAKETFDWRPRRLLTRAQIVQHWQGLTTAQQNGLMRHLLAMLIRQNRNEVLEALSQTGVPLPVDEVDPT